MSGSLSDLDRVTVDELRAELDAGRLTSRAIVEAHLDRIRRVDPAFGAVRCLAPAALDEGVRRDTADRAERRVETLDPV